MRVTYLMIFFSLSLFGQEDTKLQKVSESRTLEDYEHEFKGCPENSQCDEVMGAQLRRWKNFLNEIIEKNVPQHKKYQQMEEFRAKNGLPVEFYTSERSQLGHKPLMFHSPCKNHNPQKGLKIQKGLSFVKSISKEKGVIGRDQTQIEIPIGEIFTPQVVTVFLEEKKHTYLIPIDDGPVFMKNESLFLLKEDHDVFYVLKIFPNGEWKVVDMDMSLISEWSEKRSYVDCPKSLPDRERNIFSSDICQNIWDVDQKKLITIHMQRGCPI